MNRSGEKTQTQGLYFPSSLPFHFPFPLQAIKLPNQSRTFSISIKHREEVDALPAPLLAVYLAISYYLPEFLKPKSITSKF